MSTVRIPVWLGVRQLALLGISVVALVLSGVNDVEIMLAIGFCLVETVMLGWFGYQIHVAEAEEAATVTSLSNSKASGTGGPPSALLLRLLDSGAELVGSVAATGSNVLVIMGVAASASFLFLQLSGTDNGVGVIDASTILTVAPRAFFATAFAVLSGASLAMDGQAAQLHCRKALRLLVDGATGADESGTEGAVLAGTRETTAALAQLTAIAEVTKDAVGEVVAALSKIRDRIDADARVAVANKPQTDHHTALITLASQQMEKLETMSASIGGLANGVQVLTVRLRELGVSFDSGSAAVRSAVIETGIDASAIQSMRVAFAAAPALANAGTSLAAEVTKLHAAMTRETAGVLEQHRDAVREQAQQVTETTMNALITAALGPMRDQIQTITGDVQQRIEKAFESSHHHSETQITRYFTTVEERLNNTSDGIGKVTSSIDALNTSLGSVSVSVQKGAANLATQVPAYEDAACRFGESAAKAVASLSDAARLAEADKSVALLESLGEVARSLQAVSGRMVEVMKATEEHERRFAAARSRLADHLKLPLATSEVASNATRPGPR